MGSWLDMSKLVSSDAAEHKSPFPELAHDIGRLSQALQQMHEDVVGADVYVDINGWHLYLKDISITSDAKLHTLLARQIAPDLLSSGFDEQRIEALLKQVTAMT